MKIQVDRDRCIGSSNCVVLMPDVFTQDDDEGLVELIDEFGAGRTEASLRDVAYACPSQSIEVIDGD